MELSNSGAGASENAMSIRRILIRPRPPLAAICDLYECFKNGVVCDVVLIADDGRR